MLLFCQRHSLHRAVERGGCRGKFVTITESSLFLCPKCQQIIVIMELTEKIWICKHIYMCACSGLTEAGGDYADGNKFKCTFSRNITLSMSHKYFFTHIKSAIHLVD